MSTFAKFHLEVLKETKLKNTKKKKNFFSLKTCVRYFLTNLYFTPNHSPSKTMKNAF